MKIHRSHNGIIFGVCKGLEESLGIPAKYFRIALILGAVFFRAWVILALYLVAALFMPNPGSSEWRFQENFDSLGKVARERGRKEYRDFIRTVSSGRKSQNRNENGSTEGETANPEHSSS